MRAALARHDAHPACGDRGARRVRGEETGDGVHAVFATARRRGARRGRRRSCACAPSRGPVSEPLRVRMGSHTGVAELRDGDYFGSAVNRAARLMASRTAARSWCRRRPRSWSATPRREVDARRSRRAPAAGPRPAGAGLPGRRTPGLPARLPAAAFARRVPREPAGAADVVRRARHGADRGRGRARRGRLVTLTGVGWRGQDAPRAAGRGRGPAAVPRTARGSASSRRPTTPTTMAQVVAATLGVPHVPACRSTESIVEYLRTKRAAAGARQLRAPPRRGGDSPTPCCATCPDVRVLATSREALGVDGERVVAGAVAPAAPIRRRDPSTPIDSDAVRLFADRAERGVPDVRARRVERAQQSARSAGGSTASRWRSSSRRRGSRR